MYVGSTAPIDVSSVFGERMSKNNFGVFGEFCVAKKIQSVEELLCKTAPRKAVKIRRVSDAIACQFLIKFN